MNSIATHYHQMIGLNDDWVIHHINLDMGAQTLDLQLEFVGSQVVCPECGEKCSRKDKAPNAVGGISMQCSFKRCSQLEFHGVLAMSAGSKPSKSHGPESMVDSR